MRWTVGQRIAVGYAVVLLLLVVVAGLGPYALFRTADSFKTAIVQLETRLVTSQEADRAFAYPNVDFLRFLATGDDEFVTRYEREMLNARQMLVETVRASSTPEMKDAWEEALRLLNAWDAKTTKAMAAKKGGRVDEALRLRGEAQPFREQLVALLNRLVDSARRSTNETTQAALAKGSSAFWAILAVAGLALASGTVIAWTLTRSIVGPLRELETTARRISQRDLEARAAAGNSREIAMLAETFNTMAGNLDSLLGQIRAAAKDIASATAEILAATTQQASGTAEEATAVQETSTTVDEVKQTAQVTAQKARAVAESTQKTAQVSQDGRRAVEESVKGTQEAKARMEALAERILVLSEQGQAIGEIMATVNDLAEQSNLLAVNAAIEAAKTGEAGKGFAVVAAEVKGLAEQSKQATAQVRGILNEIQKATQAAVMAAEQGVKASEAGVAVAANAGDAIRVLTEGLTESAQAAQQILASAQQQAGGMDQVAVAMAIIRQASTQNLASTRQVERAAQDLNTLAGRLKALVAASGNERRTG